ncbi:alpha/beta hydrolase family protein [Alicyclobacillus dauci]|uniref:Tannase/feruloyl esterase family alpha/beta hydrolase n=1 Tax=Alicyclobacillus dauci TaxID=1475485 RepID=A0ABY6Z2F7_9BACL|nr:alpha/beta hydrolase [Alicyclobacillus dauci]WAH36170.1 tannase/feruloyl esterase family alpha/beta hydrolase [Alicyclobacillus dauci]
MGEPTNIEELKDLTTNGIGKDPDAEPLVYDNPKITKAVPGWQWRGMIEKANAVIRLPHRDVWNGKLLIGATPAVRNEFSLDLLLSDIAIQHGYAYAASDKATPMLILRDPARSMAEWPQVYVKLTEFAADLVTETCGERPNKTYISGVSNGGYLTRIMLERYPLLYDGGVEWEGVFWDPESRHLMTTLPVWVKAYPVYCNWRGDRTEKERSQAYEKLVDAGLNPGSASVWDQYFMLYWLVSLWLYGRNLDPTWAPFQAEWSNDWLTDPDPIANYPWSERRDIVGERIQPIANTGQLTKPLLSVAGNYDCLTPYRYHADAYAKLVNATGSGQHHRMYEINRGNHVDGLLRSKLAGQQPVQPFYEAALYALEDWVERGILPPKSGLYDDINEFTKRRDLLSRTISGAKMDL